MYEQFGVQTEEYITTGIINFDLVLGGGVCRGDLVEFASGTTMGKSVITVQIVSHWHNTLGLRVLYLDIEKGLKRSLLEAHNLQDKWTSKFGDKLCILQPTTYDDCDDVLKEVFFQEKAVYDAIILDSSAAVSVRVEKDDKISKVDPGLLARQQGKFIVKYRTQCREHGTVFWMTNQLRTKIGMGFGERSSIVAAGGKVMEHNCDIRLRMEGSSQIKEDRLTPQGKQEVKVGHTTKLFALKTRNVPPHVRLETPIYFPQGVSNAETLWKIAMSKPYNVLTNSGAHYYFHHTTPETKVFGKAKALAWLRQTENFLAVKEHLTSLGAMEIMQKVS